MAIVPFPDDCLAARRWVQAGGRLEKQRSAFTGHGPELDFGAAARWQCECTPILFEDDAQRDAFEAFDAMCQLPGAMFRMPAVLADQRRGDATLPASCTVNGAANSGRQLSVSGLTPSVRNLPAGKRITVVLPDGDEQMIRTASHLDADASGNGTVTLATPLRRTPAAGALVELALPWALMRATHDPGWSEEPGPIFTNTMNCEEAF